MGEAPAEDALKPRFVEQVSAGFRRAAPLNRFICHALDLAF
jgi:hypothetical protein